MKLNFIITLVCILMLSACYPQRDSTDDPDTGRVSGMSIKIDHLTGCQYLSRSGLTPRLDIDGSHMGCAASASRVGKRK